MASKTANGELAKAGPNVLQVVNDGSAPIGVILARQQLDPVTGNALTAINFSNRLMAEPCAVSDAVTALTDIVASARDGGKDRASDMLAAQMVSLDAAYSALMARAVSNMGEHIGATETYLRLALKAQSQARQTAEALAKLHQPREQIVKHVHVTQGGQAIVADQFHSYGGSGQQPFPNQPRAIDAPSATVPCSDSFGQAVPVASGAGECPL